MKKKRNLIFLIFLIIICLVMPANIKIFAQDPLVSNVFDNTYLVDALRDVSAQTGVAIVADSTVSGQVTLTMDNVPLEEALQRLLAAGGYAYRKMDGYYLVGAPDIKNPSFSLLSQTEIVKPRYLKAENAVRMLADSLAVYVKADRDTNTLVLTAPEKILARIKEDLAVIDQPLRQIMLEALVVDISQNGRKDLGLNWWEWTQKEAAGPGDQNIKGVQIKDFGINLAQITEGGLNSLLVSLKAAVERGNARVGANPRVATLDGQTAEIFVGRERYYSLTEENTQGAVTTTKLESIKTGISLKIQPQIAENGEITVRIEPEVSDVATDGAAGDSSLPVLNRRYVSTTVRIKDGESIVLGGLIQRSNQRVKTKIPVLGDIPILSFFFSKNRTIEEESEVLIIITPRILENGAALDEKTITTLKNSGMP
ncbi:MAG: hypothetical protein K6U80_09495 [Firmicutes bacterium]|nr:hypothetical protein [Bacillota bacterium]